MKIKIPEYTDKFRIVSLALDQNTKKDLLENNLDVIYVQKSGAILLPDDVSLTSDQSLIDQLFLCNNYDVFELWEDGELYRYYDDHSEDNSFFMTGKCNSNCLICPSSERARRTGQDSNVEELLQIAKYIPEDTPHLTITGGEPFLLGERIFDFLDYLKNKFCSTEFLLLTNGRIFALEKYVKLFCETMPNHIITGIPLHGSSPEVHDAITRTKDSFQQTYSGIKRLLNYEARIELRVVVNKMNIDNLSDLAEFISREFPQIERVCIMAMEMTGNAFINREKIWISYKRSAEAISTALMILIEHGIDARLYNFPLCTVDEGYRTLCEKSISPHKIRYAETCMKCSYKNACGGVFAGTLNLEQQELNALR